jgi:hypothetical protein
MDWQWPAVVCTVAVAAAYVARRAWRTWSGRTAGCGSCSCGPKAQAPGQGNAVRLISGDELTARLRRR